MKKRTTKEKEQYKRKIQEHIDKQSEFIQYLWRTPANRLELQVDAWEKNRGVN